MKKQFRLYLVVLLAFLMSSSFAAIGQHSRVANATYVGGNITQDTLWTLVDSPFVLYKNVTIFPNATLTIEPGVEVRFGGPFSIIVSGRLNADGMSKMISFTSNSEDPSEGDWKGIVFSGVQQSLLTNCLIAYANNSIIATNGNLEIDKSTIELCSQNGILASNSQVTITNSNVTDCLENGINATSTKLTLENSSLVGNNGNGIVITGNGQATIQQDTIIGNSNGILLAGNSFSGVNISNNIISANNQTGISIQSTTYSNLTIIDNFVSSNGYGFDVSTSMSTTITNNSVSYNNVGFYYNGTVSHTAKFNDIFGNNMGINIAVNSGPINAEQNYWGASNGPYHPLLNPSGEGNPVGGNGVNIVFIFFLTMPIAHISTPPTAILESDKSTVSVNQEVMFFATNSFDEGSINWYKFDFGDNQTSGWVTLSIFTHEYTSPGIYQAKVTVMNDFGATNQRTLSINVQTGLVPLQVSILNLNSGVTIREGGNVSVTVYVNDSLGDAVGSANVTLFSVNGGQFAQTTGLTNSSGCFTTVFTASGIIRPVYVRIVATASKATYADGSGYVYLQAYPALTVQISSNPSVISTESTQVAVIVTSNGQPINNAIVTIQTDYGTLSSQDGITGTNGTMSITFTAPQTIIAHDAGITASATKTGYVDGAGQTTITVEPKTLKASINVLPSTAYSSDIANVTVHVEYAGMPVLGANVTVAATLGNFTKSKGLTDNNGNLNFSFTSPLVSNQTAINITAIASAAGYADCQNQTAITILPRTFKIKIGTALSIVNSNAETLVTVNVTCQQDSLPVQGASVVVFAPHGSFSSKNSTTDPQGTWTLFFYAPQTTVPETINITASVTKEGYVSGANQTSVTVNPAASPNTSGGFPILMLLMIIIPVVIVIVLFVLVKRKVISFSPGEGEESAQ